MGILFLIVFFIISVFIVGLVLLQEGKGGGLTGMSAGMDGVMGAKNPLRRMTAYLFVFFVLMCVGINWYFHDSSGTALPQGMELPAAEATEILPVPTETPAPAETTETAPPAPEAPAAPAVEEAAE